MEANKVIIRGVLTASQTALTIQEVAKEYRNTVGEPIPYQKWGYNSLEHFLRSIPDTVLVTGSGPHALVNPVLSEKSLHVMEMVSKQKPAVRRKGRFPMFTMRRQVINPPPDCIKNYKPPVTRSQSQKIFYPNSKNTQVHSSAASSVSNSTNQSCYKPTVSSNSNSVENNCSNQKKVENSTTAKAIEKSFSSESKCELLEDSINIKLENLKVSTPKIFSAQNLRRSHSSFVVPDEKFRSGVYGTVNAKRKSMYTNKHNIRNDISLSPVSKIENMKNNLSDSTTEREKCVPEIVKKNLRHLIGKFYDGIWCSDLPGEYRKMFKRELAFQELGFKNLIELCNCLKSIFHFVRPSNDDCKLYDRSKPLPTNVEKNFTVASFNINSSSEMESNAALPNFSWSDIDTFLPPNVFKYGNEIPRAFVSKDAKEGDVINVIVAEVYDISKFWVYRDDGELDKLMDDIQAFYGNLDSDYKLSPSLLKQGMYCVAMYYAEYHRALIVDTTPQEDEKIRVFFIDYGTMDRIKPELLFLHEQFAQLPAQPIRCRLANVCPTEEKAPWSFEAIKAFRQLCTNRNLVAKISRIDWEYQYLEIYLADVTDNSNVFYINDILVREGFATYPDQQYPNELIDTLSIPIVNRIHLFPTFLELEHGLTPSTKEMAFYHEYNTPIHFCYPQYFKIDHSEEEKIIQARIEFYETYIKRRLRQQVLPHHSSYDFAKLNDAPIDFSIFGELEEEMRMYCKNIGEESENDIGNAEIDAAVENKENLWKQTLTDLKRDCDLSEDILGILNVCKENNNDTNFKQKDLVTSSPVLEACEDLEREIPYSEDYDGNYNHPLEHLSFSRSTSADSIGYTGSDVYPDSLIDPDKSSEESDDKFSDNNFDNAQIDPNPFKNSKYLDFLNDISNEDNQYLENDDDRPVENVNEQQPIALNHNNPFLEALGPNSDKVEADIVSNNGRLLSTNPFLSYNISSLPKEDVLAENSDSSSSTDYGTYVQEFKTVQAWSNVDHVYNTASSASISENYESLDSAGAAANAQFSKLSSRLDQHPDLSIQDPAEFSNQHPDLANQPLEPLEAANSRQSTSCSTLTENIEIAHSIQSAPAAFNVNTPEFYPQNYFFPPNPYIGYPVYYGQSHPQLYPNPMMCANPYYNIRQQFNRGMVMRSSFNVMQTTAQMYPQPPPGLRKAVCPPPGFENNSNVFKPGLNSAQQRDFYESYNDMLKERFTS